VDIRENSLHTALQSPQRSFVASNSCVSTEVAIPATRVSLGARWLGLELSLESLSSRHFGAFIPIGQIDRAEPGAPLTHDLGVGAPCAPLAHEWGPSVLGHYHTPIPSRLKRYQTEGHYHFLTFSCYRRLPFLCDEGRTLTGRRGPDRLLVQSFDIRVFTTVLAILATSLLADAVSR